MSIDVARARADTPGCAEVAHLNNSGASLMPAPVLDVVVAYLEREARKGGYETADALAAELEAVYDSVARLIGAHRDEIAIVENATRAWDMVFYGMRFAERAASPLIATQGGLRRSRLLMRLGAL